jgi:hypothetical protein
MADFVNEDVLGIYIAILNIIDQPLGTRTGQRIKAEKEGSPA